MAAAGKKTSARTREFQFAGVIGNVVLMRDPETGGSRGFGFVNYDSFEASDLAIECMHQQVRVLCYQGCALVGV